MEKEPQVLPDSHVRAGTEQEQQRAPSNEILALPEQQKTPSIEPTAIKEYQGLPSSGSTTKTEQQKVTNDEAETRPSSTDVDALTSGLKKITLKLPNPNWKPVEKSETKVPTKRAAKKPSASRSAKVSKPKASSKPQPPPSEARVALDSTGKDVQDTLEQPRSALEDKLEPMQYKSPETVQEEVTPTQLDGSIEHRSEPTQAEPPLRADEAAPATSPAVHSDGNTSAQQNDNTGGMPELPQPGHTGTAQEQDMASGRPDSDTAQKPKPAASRSAKNVKSRPNGQTSRTSSKTKRNSRLTTQSPPNANASDVKPPLPVNDTSADIVHSVETNDAGYFRPQTPMQIPDRNAHEFVAYDPPQQRTVPSPEKQSNFQQAPLQWLPPNTGTPPRPSISRGRDSLPVFTANGRIPFGHRRSESSSTIFFTKEGEIIQGRPQTAHSSNPAVSQNQADEHIWDIPITPQK